MVGSTAGSLESYESILPGSQRMRRVASSSSVSGLAGLSFSNVYLNVWNTLLTLAKDPHYLVALKAQTVVASINIGVTVGSSNRSTSTAISAPSSPSSSIFSRIGTPPTTKGAGMPAEDQRKRDHTSPTHQRNSNNNNTNTNNTSTSTGTSSYSLTYSRRRKMFDKGPDAPDGHEQEQAGGSTVMGVATQFFQWSCNYFTQPKLRVPPEHDPESNEYFRHDWHLRRNRSVVRQARQTIVSSGVNKLDEQLFVNKVNTTPTVILFHPFEKFVAVNENHGVSFWDWEAGGRVAYIENTLHVLPEKGVAITSMNFINAHSNSMLLCGTEDGAVRIWDNYLSMGEARLITAFQALNDVQLLSRGAGLVTEFEQSTGTLYAAGDVRYIRIWDARTELKIQDMPTGADSCVTSLAIDSQGGSLIVAGCGDGTVRLFDKRLAPADCRVMTLREHGSWVVNVHYQTGAVGKIISGSNCGDVRLWDPRFTESVNHFPVPSALSAMSVHKSADIVACGCTNQSISIHNMTGETISTIKYHDGFLGQRIGNITCLTFHPYMVMLGAGSMDNTLSVFGNPKS